jgi:replication-associated recombination protein RarA
VCVKSGQGHLKSALQMIMTSKNSIILWGPSGSGKTTLARCLKDELNRREEEAESSCQTKRKKYEFFELSATDFSTSEWKKIIDQNHLSSASSNTSNTSGNGSNQKISSFYKSSNSAVTSIPIIFIDEVQRLNKSQQDR